MRKLIIPNTSYEPTRFLWMIEAGDIILLDKIPSKQFINYLCKIKKIPHDSFKIVIPAFNGIDISNPATLLNEVIIKRIQEAILGKNHTFTICPYVFNSTIIELANKLAIPIDDRWKRLVKNKTIEKLNDKREFRNLVHKENIPHPMGTECSSMEALAKAIPKYLSSTGKIIIKQPYAGGGLGNIGVSNLEHTFFGVHKSYLINEHNIKLIAQEIWLQYTDRDNQQLIIEVYYPHKTTITAILKIDEKNQIQLVNTGVIYFLPIKNTPLHQPINLSSGIQWIQMPAVGISNGALLNLINYSYIIAQHIQHTGYRGLLSVDAIITYDHNLKFTEMNVRNGGETHINYLINKLFDHSEAPFNNTLAMLASIDNFSLPIDQILQRLEEHELLFNQHKGIIIINLNDDIQKLQYLVLAQDENHLNELQKKFINIANNPIFHLKVCGDS